MNDDDLPPLKPLIWLFSSRRDLKAFPAAVTRDMGHALYLAQLGAEAENVKALKGFGGRGVLEVRADHATDTYRAVYTVRFAAAVYVLHCFQKKAKRGAATPQPDLELIRRRLKAAEDHYRERLVKEPKI